MSVYSTQFFAGVLPTTATVIYTVPSPMTVVIRDIEVFNGGVGVNDINFSQGESGAAIAVLARFVGLASLHFAQWTGRAVLKSGDELIALGGQPGCTGLVSGYLLAP